MASCGSLLGVATVVVELSASQVGVWCRPGGCVVCGAGQVGVWCVVQARWVWW